jgi:hypothetical protein
MLVFHDTYRIHICISTALTDWVITLLSNAYNSYGHHSLSLNRDCIFGAFILC